MSSIFVKFKSLYNDTSTFYKFYFIVNGITYLSFPQTREIISENTGLLLINASVGTIEQIIKTYYPSKEILCDITKYANLISRVCIVGYISYNFDVLGNLCNSTIINYCCFAQKIILKSISSMGYLSCVCGIVGSFTTWCVGNTLDLIYGSQIRSVLVKINTYLDELTNFSNTTDNSLKTQIINIFKELFNKPLTEYELDTVAPLRCSGMRNVTHKFDINSCSICTEEFSSNTLHRVLPCKHAFHAHCVDKWLLHKSSTCPMCRKNITDFIKF